MNSEIGLIGGITIFGKITDNSGDTVILNDINLITGEFFEITIKKNNILYIKTLIGNK